MGNKGINLSSTEQNASMPNSFQMNPKPINTQSTSPDVFLISNRRNNGSEFTSGFILNAVDDIENQFWNYPVIEREDSIVTISLCYLQKLLKF